MENQKIANLIDNASNWVEINDESRETYSAIVTSNLKLQC